MGLRVVMIPLLGFASWGCVVLLLPFAAAVDAA
jgi:hypothetical protein